MRGRRRRGKRGFLLVPFSMLLQAVGQSRGRRRELGE